MTNDGRTGTATTVGGEMVFGWTCCGGPDPNEARFRFTGPRSGPVVALRLPRSASTGRRWVVTG